MYQVDKLYKPFKASMDAKWQVEFIDVIPVYMSHGLPKMGVCTLDGPIYITRQQAMDFFGLVNPKIEIVKPEKM